MKPIGQTFFINEPPPPVGSPGVYITKIDVFFKSVSNTYGIEMQIRTTENGVPTTNMLPFGQKILQASEVSASNDASAPTTFEFETPVLVRASETYAFVLAPLGGNPDYEVWSAQISEEDVTTGTPIYTNNDTGDLFLSSNDRSWTPVINEDLKFNIYIANFTSQTGTAYFSPTNEDRMLVFSRAGSFVNREGVVFSNNIFNVAVLNIASANGSFNAGDILKQGNSTVYVQGKIYSTNSTVIKISNTTGAFAANTLVTDVSTNATANITSVSQNAVVTSNSTTMSVPDTSIFTANQYILIGTNNRSQVVPNQINNISSSNTIILKYPVAFSDTNALYGDVWNPTFKGYIAATKVSHFYPSYDIVILDQVTSNSSINLANSHNRMMFGVLSGASAYVHGLVKFNYSSLTTNFTYLTPSNTGLSWAFAGFAANTNYPADSTFTSINPGSINEFTNETRSYLSRSDEYVTLPVGRAGNSSMVIKSSFTSTNNKISPYIDTLQNSITVTQNVIVPENKLKGYYLFFANTGYVPANGDIVYQSTYGNTSSATIAVANNIAAIAYYPNGILLGNTAFTNQSNSVGTITAAIPFGEWGSNNTIYSSRYISKNVILASGQDSEDLMVYAAAYRPATTDILMYAKVLNAHDTSFDSKDWSRLNQLTSPSLYSSSVDSTDLIELQWTFNTSILKFGNSTATSNSSNTISCISTADFSNNSFIYLYSNDSANNFNVRQIVYVVNSTAVVVDRPPSFTATDAALGVIPGIESTQSAFLFDQNKNILRYCTKTDNVYDTYIQFAIKIVPVANTTAQIPLVHDLRCIALQV